MLHISKRNPQVSLLIETERKTITVHETFRFQLHKARDNNGVIRFEQPYFCVKAINV